MNELTIREKIQEIARINEAAYGHVHIDFIRAFARLICEEMMDNFDPEDQYQTEFAKTRARGWNQREQKIRQKAQEILKALE